VTQDRCCVLAFGPGLDRKASNAWAIRIPTLRIMNNTAITSNIDGPLRNGFNKASTFLHSQRDSVERMKLPTDVMISGNIVPQDVRLKSGL
jgi:hypothetical protein